MQNAEDACLEEDSHVFYPESQEELNWVTQMFKWAFYRDNISIGHNCLWSTSYLHLKRN